MLLEYFSAYYFISMMTVIIVSIVSMLCYISAEMVYPLVPIYLTTVLGTAPAIVGLIEGVANSFSALIKFYSGFYADKKQNKKRLLLIGYGGAIINYIILIFSSSWTWILGGRISDRFCKAIRTAPRDAVVYENAKNKSIAFGINEAFNALGASIGIFIAYILVYHSTAINYKKIFIIATIPIILGVLILLFLKKEENRGLLNIDLRRFNKKLKKFFVIAFFSSLANSTKTILLLKATDLGFSPSSVILLYLLINLTNALVSYPAGIISTKIKMKNLLIFTYGVFAIVYLGLGLTSNNIIVILLYALYGVYLSLIAISSRTFVSDNSPSDMKASALGFCNALVSFASLPATIIAGVLWTFIGPNSAFLFSGIIGLLSAFLIFIFINEKV